MSKKERSTPRRKYIQAQSLFEKALVLCHK
jgi:hypothetical protein